MLTYVLPRSPGRPVAASKAWSEIVAFQIDNFADENALDMWRRKVRTRAQWHRFHVHRSVLGDLVQSRFLVASGLRAAAFQGVPVEPDENQFIGYVAAIDLPEIQTGVPVLSGDGWNVELGVVATGAWRFGRSVKFADPVTTWLDLEDHRHRSARLMLEVVRDARG